MISRITQMNGVPKVSRTRLIIVAVLVIILLIVIFGGDNGNETPQELKNEFPQVSLATVNELARAGNIELIGTVESVNEARLEAETSGRITSVSVAIGDIIRAGQTIAQIENADEYATLLQAEGAYEAALAAAASDDIDIATALADGVSTYRDAFITVDGLVRNTIDDQFSRPTSSYPNFKLYAFGDREEIIDDRIIIEGILDDITREIDIVTTKNIEERLTSLRIDIQFIYDFSETIAYIVTKQDVTDYFTQTEKDVTEAEFLSARNSLSNTLQEIDGALDNILQARLSATGGEISAADASVKQALGTLKAAQAAYNKTIITTPIAGTVNKVSVQTGDFVNAFDSIADVANNNALKITAYINASERERVNVGTPVVINKTLEGSVSRVAPAIDPATGKIEVQIQIESEKLTNGDSVSLSINPEIEVSESEPLDAIRVPLPAIKLTTTTAYVFTIEDERLVAHEVMLGDVQSDSVEILSGIDPDWNIVLDARGLANGQRVNVTE